MQRNEQRHKGQQRKPRQVRAQQRYERRTERHRAARAIRQEAQDNA